MTTAKPSRNQPSDEQTTAAPKAPSPTRKRSRTVSLPGGGPASQVVGAPPAAVVGLGAMQAGQGDQPGERPPLSLPPLRPSDVAFAQRYVDRRRLIADIADQLQIVGDPREPATLRIVPRPPEYSAVEVRLLAEVGDLIEQVSADHHVPVEVLVDGVLWAWLNGTMTSTSADRDPHIRV